MTRNFLSILVLIFTLMLTGTVVAQQSLSASEFRDSVSKPDIQVLDVRTPAEYAGGHLDSVFLADWNARDAFIQRVSSLDKSKPVYVYCLSGVRSGQAAEWMAKHGFITYTLSGGINAWKKEGFAITDELKVPQVSQQEFMISLPKQGTVLVNFSADWCPPCHKMQPVIDSLLKTDGHLFRLVKVNGGQQAELNKAFAVDEFPTFIIFKNGKETWRTQGLVDAAELRRHF